MGKKARGPQVAGWNKLWVTDYFFFLFYTKSKEAFLLFEILCWWHLALPRANQCIFLMEIFFLSHVSEATYLFAICLSSKLFHHRLRFIYLFSFHKSWAENGSVFLSIVLWLQDDTPHAILSQKCISWERGLVNLNLEVLPQPWGAPSTLRCLSYLINSFLTDIKHLVKNWQGGTISVPFWCLYQMLSLSLLYYNKTLLYKKL